MERGTDSVTSQHWRGCEIVNTCRIFCHLPLSPSYSCGGSATGYIFIDPHNNNNKEEGSAEKGKKRVGLTFAITAAATL